MEKMLMKLRALNLPEPILVVGMGISGRRALDLLREAGYEAFGVDEKVSERRIHQRNLDDPEALKEAGLLVVSPGIDRRREAFKHTFVQQINDVELFALLNDKPVLAVTGSNGKSTVVTLLHEALLSVGKKSKLCGNIGYSVLEALFSDDETDCFVMELSSYQLEICPSLHPMVGAILNITPDHLDRYDSMNDYIQAKANLAVQSNITIFNVDDEHCLELTELAMNAILFGENPSLPNRVENGQILINHEAIVSTDSLNLVGKHNEINVLCVLLFLKAFGIDPKSALPAIQSFKGLPHRAQVVAERNGVKFVDDSKATNIGAVIACLAGLSAPIILIAGGVGKGQDFNLLTTEMKKHPIKTTLLIGKDNADLESALKAENLPFEVCGEMVQAVKRAKALAVSGDIVLLSPATASFDQYSGYHERGNHFAYEAQQNCN